MTELDQIQDYLDGKLSDSEVLAFKAELKEKGSLRKEFERALVAKQISEGMLELDMREVIRKQHVKTRNRWIVFGGVMIVLLLMMLYFSRSMWQSEKSLYAMEYIEPLWPGQRGSAESLDQVLYDFRDGDDLQITKTKITSLDEVSEELQEYWIAEIFLARGELDSALIYIPSLDVEHWKYSRTLWMKEFIRKQKKQKKRK